jgi:hypothetical protein
LYLGVVCWCCLHKILDTPVYLDYVKEYLVYGSGTLIWYRLAQVSVNRLMALLQGRGAPVSPGRLIEYHPLSLRRTPPAITSPVKKTCDHLEALHVDKLTLHHPESEAGIDGISFTIERGTLTAIVGRIGSGKTTLLRALLGLLLIDGGEVRWNGNRVDDLAAYVPKRGAEHIPRRLTPEGCAGSRGSNPGDGGWETHSLWDACRTTGDECGNAAAGAFLI